MQKIDFLLTKSKSVIYKTYMCKLKQSFSFQTPCGDYLKVFQLALRTLHDGERRSTAAGISLTTWADTLETLGNSANRKTP